MKKDTTPAAADAVGSQLVRGVRPASEATGRIEDLAHRMCWRYKYSTDPAHSHTYTFNRATLLAFADAILEQQRAWAQQAEARAIAAESAEGQRVLAERERLRVLVQAVRDANAVEAHADYPFRVLTALQERAWMALLAGLEGPNVRAKPGATVLRCDSA